MWRCDDATVVGVGEVALIVDIPAPRQILDVGYCIPPTNSADAARSRGHSAFVLDPQQSMGLSPDVFTKYAHDEGGSASRMTDEGGRQREQESNNQEGESMAEEEVSVEPGIQ